jgi:hypothetical protein
MKYIVKNGIEHHVAMSASPSAVVLQEALGTYLGCEVYQHERRLVISEKRPSLGVWTFGSSGEWIRISSPRGDH